MKSDFYKIWFRVIFMRPCVCEDMGDFYIYRKRLSLPYSFRPRNIIFHLH
nr:MAG TPA: hypothetical protein [Caudoviricetes sp.]